jgi:hypothetical protein
MSTKAELEIENEQLRSRVAELEAGRPVRPVPVAPSFGMCAGVAADLEQVEKTTDPFTGKVVTREGVELEEDDEEPAEPAAPGTE